MVGSCEQGRVISSGALVNSGRAEHNIHVKTNIITCLRQGLFYLLTCIRHVPQNGDAL